MMNGILPAPPNIKRGKRIIMQMQGKNKPPLYKKEHNLENGGYSGKKA
jgi:hypothetical protein